MQRIFLLFCVQVCLLILWCHFRYKSVISMCWQEVPMNRLTFRDIVKKLDCVLSDADAQM